MTMSRMAVLVSISLIPPSRLSLDLDLESRFTHVYKYKNESTLNVLVHVH